MKKIKRFFTTRRSSGEAGQALILVLIFLTLGSLTLVPTLTHISTALKTGEVYEQNTNELYTADAGIEDSLWRIKYDFMGTDYSPYDFETAYPYQTADLNGMVADFTIMNVWFPSNVNLVDPYASGYIDMTPEEVEEMMESEKLIVSGSALPGQPYRILIDFNPDAGDNLTIKSLGVWLPRDFTYTDNSCSLQVDGAIYEPDDITIAEAPGGNTILWSYDAPYPYINQFPNYDSVDITFNFTFEYTPPAAHPGWLPAAIAWVTTEMHDQHGNPKFPLNSPENVPVSWDIDTRYFKMISEAGDTIVEAYTSKNELRQMGDAMAGDYVAIGNALLLNNDGDRYRDDWSTPSSFTLDTIPENADVVYAFLYWSGWRNEDAIEDVFYDNCSDFDNWDRNQTGIQSQTAVPTSDGINAGSWNRTPSSPADYYSRVDETTPDDTDYITGFGANQVRVPTGDGYNSGSWTYYPSGWPNPSNYYSRVDETTPNDTDYITGTTDFGGYRLFTFSNFTVPSGSTINGLTVYFRARDVSGTNPNNNLRARLRVDGSYYDASSSIDPTTTWTTYSYTWDENPRTGNPWTVNEINRATWQNELEQFGIYSTDFNPDIQVSMAYAEVDYSGGYRLFDFQDFTVPSNSEIDSLTIYFRARDASSGTNDLCASIYVQNTRYDASSSVDPGSDWTTYSYTWDENPRTGATWIWQDINGGGSNSLLQFGVSSTDFNPEIDISMVYAEVKYYESRWVITSYQFEGQGTGVADPEPRILTQKNGINLTSFGTGLFSISWDQDESGNLDGDDTFFYAFSGDGGTTWSSWYKAFSGNDPASPFTTTIPDEYATNNFKIRYYFNFDSSSKSVFLDDIEITYLPVDTDVIFKINDQQVYFDGNDPAIGPYKITAGRSYTMRNYLSGPHGFSYACVRDVSALVKTYPIDLGEEHHTGNAKYTIDDVMADTRNGYSLSEIAFANWSLIVVYTSPETAGHYIYIRDDNFCSHTSGDTSALDFDQDGIPGGQITGFKIPNPITDAHGTILETVAAKLTCFVVEGDSWYYDDYFRVTGEQSGLSKYLSNARSPYDNVWNDRSYPGTISDGVDIDTFELKWDDGILTPGDKNLEVDLYSNTDAWNLVYFIISIRSETVTTGTSHYMIYGN
jgi:hypothetical protein